MSAGFGVQDWTLLGALAIEQALPQSVIEQLSPPPAMPAPMWLKRTQTEGWVVPARLPRSGSLKPHFAVHPDYEQLVLRQLAESGELERIAAVLRVLLSARSVSDLTLALHSGGLDEFQRRYAARKRPPESAASTRAEWLRRSLCEPFDALWLTRAWGDDALRVSTLVLEECLIGPARCDELYAWLAARSEATPEAEADPALSSTLYQHAVLRGELERVPRLVPLVSSPQRRLFSAAVRFVEGNLPDAQQRLDAGLTSSSKRQQIPDSGALAPLFALLLCARDDDDGRAAAKRVLSAARGELNRGAQRALRTLLRHLSEPPEEQRRLDVHQLPSDVGAWEILILALTVHLHSPDKWARANWCQDVLRRARDWQRAGYAWLARQALFLAQMLNEQHFASELARLELPALTSRGSRELLLWDLISTKPEWQKALDALAQISDVAAEANAHSYRVAWYGRHGAG